MDEKGFISEEVFANGPWYYFERAIARYFVCKGWENVEIVGGTGDKGADILATLGENDYIIQVKFSAQNRLLSTDIVGDVVRAMEYYEINNGFCISNRNLSEGQKTKLNGYKKTGYNILSFTGGRLLESFQKLDTWINDPRTPHRYQQESVQALKESYCRGDSGGLISLATGMGKTFIACLFLRWLYENEKNINILVLAHREELLNQFERSLWYSLPKFVPTNILTADYKPVFSNGVLLSSFGSFLKWHKENQDRIFDIVIVDEAHHARANTYCEVLDSLNPKYKIGLTATPYRTDGLSITEIFGRPLVYYNVSKGIKNKFLSEVDYKLRCDNIDNDWITEHSLKGYTIKQLNKKLFIYTREEKICELFIKYWEAENRTKAIIFCQSISHALKIEKILRLDFNFPCISLTNKEKPRENARRLRQFRKGDVKALAVFDILNEGVDIPDVDFICFLRVTHSRVYFLQQLGRGLRYKIGKRLLVLDFVADLRRIKAVQRQEKEYYDDSEEYLDLDPGFKLEFSNDFTDDFLRLVSEDIESEFLDENEIIV